MPVRVRQEHTKLMPVCLLNKLGTPVVVLIVSRTHIYK